MASRFMDSAQRSASSGAIDAPLAALVAVALAFVAYAMPVDLLTRLVEMSQLPSLLPAAEPPLGFKARALFSLAAAVAGFLAVFALLRALGGRETPQPMAEIEQEEAPRLRRSDFHPDAPARRPILAGRDFGEPEAAAEPVDPWSPVEPAAEPGHEEIASEPEPLELAGPPMEAEEIEVSAPAPDVVQTDEPGEAQSIAELMSRLERGLSRRLQAKQSLRATEPASPPAFENDDGDERLRSAIENLQRMASRAG